MEGEGVSVVVAGLECFGSVFEVDKEEIVGAFVVVEEGDEGVFGVVSGNVAVLDGPTQFFW